jgi:hypothetical protein
MRLLNDLKRSLPKIDRRVNNGGDRKSLAARRAQKKRLDKIIQMRLKGARWKEIAAEVNSSVSACSMAFWNYLKTVPTHDADQQRQAMNERLRQISWTLWKKFDDQPLRAVDALIAVENRIARLNGLDMTAESKISSQDADSVPLSLELFAELRQRYEVSP